VWKNRKIHGAGVVAILPLDVSMILTGSYDDHLRLLNVEKVPKVLAEQNLDGGVWRLKLMNSHKDETATYYDILASCMHAGVCIVRITIPEDGVPQIKVLAKFEEHESMNYGSDFVVSKDDIHEYTILSTSFYDKRLCLWKYRTPAFTIGGD
jgi:diphthamide biosynthesis protein 7